MTCSVNAKCGTCGQVWHVCDLPQELSTAARLMRDARCPNGCAGQATARNRKGAPMAENSNIEWTDHTFNPWIGCQKVSPGCDHCYAETWDARGLQQRETRWGPHAARTRTSPANWRKPLAWNRAAQASGKRARVFCASLADVFDNHASILAEWRAALWQLIAATPHLDWLLLTKRPQNIAKMLPEAWGGGWPNVWLGTTVENQTEADRRIPRLLAVPARVRFLSCEPLLGPVDLTRWIGTMPYIPGASTYVDQDGHVRQDLGGGLLDSLDWVICGGESGPGARPMHPDWARSLRDQCHAAGVAFFFKQWGEYSWSVRHEPPQATEYPLKAGKKAAGRLLDGRTWDEVPGAVDG